MRKRKKYTTAPSKKPLFGKRQYQRFAHALNQLDVPLRVSVGIFVAAVLIDDNPTGFQTELFLKEAGILPK